ncbi:MAG: prolipoprotein diacylglyceryl transferase [Candidatus Omnitrophica bacterium]|nr:prolipoprotein diacylglyceryl transferase [Candidatus Omnitrophota bacterium]MCM8790795.1 prolipoprotein diacylglyceryl transferase [Candidatus Omnitrophota bacterium]
MHPILFKLGPISVYSYGVMVALGFAVSLGLIWHRAPTFGLDRDKVIDYAILVLITGVAGARILYVLLNLEYYVARPLEVVNLSKGGLVWYGGFALALTASLLFVRIKRLDFWAMSDLVAPYLALAQAFGRVGCFFNGCCYGVEVRQDFPLGAVLAPDGISRFPAQLYSAFLLIAIFALLRFWQDRKHFNGEIFLGYCMLYADKRFFMEFLRGDNPKILMGLTLSQLISISVFMVASALFVYMLERWKKGISSA